MASTVEQAHAAREAPVGENTGVGMSKLSGRAFYKSIGSPKLILAPMVDQSEFAWRLLTRSYLEPQESKSLLSYTPMLHARLFQEQARYRDQNFQPTRSGLTKLPVPDHKPETSDVWLDGNPELDRPLTVQFCANDPDHLLEAAKYVQPYCDAVDLNLGCPQGIARKGHYGAFLQEDWDLVYRLINKLHKGLHIPVTAKIRIQETKEKTLEYANMVLSAGASILTVHGRQRDQKGHKTGLADWTVIRYLREHLPFETVLFANGNILRHEDIARCLKETGADGVMSAEGNLHDPTIFSPPPKVRDDRVYWQGRNGKGAYRLDAVFRKYMSIIYKHVLNIAEPERAPLFVPGDQIPDFGLDEDTAERPAKRQKKEKKSQHPHSPNLNAMQAHLFRLLRPLISTKTHVRNALARSRAGDIEAFEHVLKLTEQGVCEGLQDYEADPEKYEADMAEDTQTADGNITDYQSSVKAVKACKRPWWCAQSYVRPLPQEALEKGSIQLSKKEKQELERQRETKMQTALPKEVNGLSEREKQDVENGLDRKEVSTQAMVAG